MREEDRGIGSRGGERMEGQREPRPDTANGEKCRIADCDL